MKKKIVALALATVMTISLAGCSSKMSDDNVTVNQYKKLEIAEVAKEEVTDAQVENVIKSYVTAAPLRTEVTDRGAEEGDTVEIDYEGSVDGTLFEGGSATDAGLVLGSGSYVGKNGDYKGFEEQIVGHKKGEKFDIEVKFPDNYGVEDLKGKVANFAITLNGIYTTSGGDELTDEWVQQNSEKSKTVKEFKEEVRENMEKNNESSRQSTLRNEILAALDEQIEVNKYPEGDVEKEYQAVEDYYNSYADQYGVELAEFLQTYMSMTEDEFKTKATEVAQNAVKRKLACELIAKKKHLEPSDKEIEEKTKEYAERSGYSDVEGFKKVYDDETIRSTIIQEKVSDYLLKYSVQVEQKSEENTTEDKATDTKTTDEKTTDTKK